MPSRRTTLPDTKTIEIQLLRTPTGEGTCCTKEGSCPFYLVRGFGADELCFFGGERLWRGDSEVHGKGAGYLIPNAHCPLWAL